MFNYIDVITILVISVSLFISLVKTGQTICKKQTINVFICLLYSTMAISLIMQMANYFLCRGLQNVSVVCIVTWITFSVSLEWSLSALTILTFANYYIIQSQSIDFLVELQNAKRSLILFALLVPLAFNGFTAFSHSTLYVTFLPPTSRYQVIVLFVPIICLLFLIVAFTCLSIGAINKTQDTSQNFKYKYTRAMKIQLIMLLCSYIPYLIVLVMAQFSFTLNQTYTIFQTIVNTSALQYTYLYGINPFLIKLQILKLSKITGINASAIDSSEPAISVADNLSDITPSITEIPSKVAEYGTSRDSVILSKQKGQIVSNSDNMNRNHGIELHDRAQSQDIK